MRQPGQLPLTGFYHAPVGMPGGGHTKRRGQIKVLFPVGIPDRGTPGAFPDDGPGTVFFDKEDISRLKIPKQSENLFSFGHNLRLTIYDGRAFEHFQCHRKS